MLYLVFEFERRSNSLFYVAKLANAKMGYLIQVFQLLLDSKLAILLFRISAGSFCEAQEIILGHRAGQKLSDLGRPVIRRRTLK